MLNRTFDILQKVSSVRKALGCNQVLSILVSIRLLALDLDGTLLDSNRTIPALNRDAVRRAVAAGVTVVLASGRNAPSVARYAGELGLEGPRVCCNGAHVLLAPELELLHIRLDPALCRSVLAYAAREDLHVHAYSRERLLFLSDDRWGDLYLSRVGGVVPELLSAEDVDKLEITKMMLVADRERIVREHLRFSNDGVATQSHLTLSEPEYLEFLPRDANKGSGLRAVAAALDVPRHEVAAVGDYLNDMEMLQWAGTSAAMANAHPAIQEVADIVVESNDRCGVASFIDSQVTNRRQ